MSHETTGAGDGDATPASPEPPDPAAILQSRGFVVVVVGAAVIGLLVSLVSWGFLELVHQIQVGVFSDLPDALGYDTVPGWYLVLVLGLAGVPVALAVTRLPGHGGHVPAYGLQPGGASSPATVPGVAIAALATLGLGLVLGPEAPLIAIGAGVAVFAVQRAKRDAPPQLLIAMAAAGSFAAISAIFGSPIVAAIFLIEATGIGGATLPLVLIPGLVAAGVGSLVFVGTARWTGLPTAAYSLSPLELPKFGGITWGLVGWTIALGLAGALVTQLVRGIGFAGLRVVPRRPLVWVPVVGVLVAALAVVFAATTTHDATEVLFSGQDALPGLVGDAATWSVGALLMVMLCKGVAWGLCLSAFRGGPTFPAIFLGAAGGVAASHLPGLPMTPAVAVGMAVMVVSFLKLPLSSVVIATVLAASGGAATGPLIIVGVAVAYLATLGLEGRLGARRLVPAPPVDP
ncbi:MAG: chloride channel protein [Actinomycetota bacterium]